MTHRSWVSPGGTLLALVSHKLKRKCHRPRVSRFSPGSVAPSLYGTQVNYSWRFLKMQRSSCHLSHSLHSSSRHNPAQTLRFLSGVSLFLVTREPASRLWSHLPYHVPGGVSYSSVTRTLPLPVSFSQLP